MLHLSITRKAAMTGLIALLLPLLLAPAGCSNNDTVAPEVGTPLTPETVNDFVSALPTWEVPSDVELEPILVDETEDFTGNAYLRCEIVEYDRKQNFDNLISVGANSTALKPGMLVQGRGVRSGALSVIGLKRSPIKISVDLALETPSRSIEVPSSATIQEAVASIQREADTRLGNLDVIPAQISFQTKEVYSFEQAMLDAGISLKYSAVLASGSIGSSISQSSTNESHTVIAKIFQPMYTISFADDEIAEPAAFFHQDVTEADFSRQIQLGTMGPDNQPCYVQSVTYGRMVIYTMTSSEATSSEELKVAIQASYGVYSGSGNIDQRQSSLVTSSTIEVQVFGGTQGDATNAIKEALRNGDFSAFLTPVPATTALPLSYRINDMKNRSAAVIGDATKYSIETCREFTDMRFTVSLDRIEIVQGGEFEETFDLESYISFGSDSYWLLHNSGSRFSRDDLANVGQTAIFEFSATPGTFMTFTVVDFGNGSTGRNSWSRDKRVDYPFNFETIPHEFSIFETSTDSNFNNTTLEIFFTIKRELIDIT